MSEINAKLAQYRKRNKSFIDGLVYREGLEILDEKPSSEEAGEVVADLEKFAVLSRLDKFLVNDFLRKVIHIENPKILEICAGSGWLGKKLSTRLTKMGVKHTIWVTDINNSWEVDTDVLRWKQADATRLQFADEAFDLVIGSQSLHHFNPEMLQEVLKESCRVGKNVAIFDIRRTFYGFIFVSLFRPLFSKEFIHDGIVSHRRAYKVKEIDFILKERQIPMKVKKFLPLGMLVEKRNFKND